MLLSYKTTRDIKRVAIHYSSIPEIFDLEIDFIQTTLKRIKEVSKNTKEQTP